MTTRKRAALAGLILLLLAAAAAVFFLNNQEGFTGSCVKNPDANMLDIQRMNGTDLHTLELQEGDALHIRFQTEQGALYLEIKAPDGASVYRGNGQDVTDFTVNVPEDGVYTILVEARRAKGSIQIYAEGTP